MLNCIDVVEKTNDECLCDFLIHIKNVKGASVNTLQAYKRDILKFFDFLDVKEISAVCADSAVVSDFSVALAKSSLSDASICRIMSSVRGFYKYLFSCNIVVENPSKVLKNQKSEKAPTLDILTGGEVEKLLSQPNVSDFKGLRDKAMLEVLYSTGLKVSELISLDLSDVNLKLGYVRCDSGKTKKERLILLYPLAVKFLLLYIDKSRKIIISGAEETNALFVNLEGGRMTRQGFWKILKGYADHAGIDKHITPIALRHSFAAHLIENGADLNDIKEILGHVNLSSTMVYENYLKSKLSSSYLKFHPRA